MRIEFTGTEALRNARSNPQRSWTGVAERMNAGQIFDVYHKPKFVLDPDWPVFTIGSCFARRIEEALMRRNVPVLARGHGVPNRYREHYKLTDDPQSILGADNLNRGPLNKYSVRSMLHEVRNVLAGEAFPDHGLIELAENTWFDPHSAGLNMLDYDTARANRRRIEAATAEVRNARVVVLTLGQTETWLDAKTGLHCNRMPGAVWLRKLSDRFHFVDFGYEETYQQIKDVISLIKEHCRADMRFILTVSPVPMTTTFRPIDTAVANSATKTMLRTIAETISREYDTVDYFPSYEIVTLSPPSLAYGADKAHVTGEAVAVIMNRFMTSYYPGLPVAALAQAPEVLEEAS